MVRKTKNPPWQPSPDDYQRLIHEQNEWHESGVVPEVYAPSVERTLAKELPQRLLCGFPDRFQLVLGPRRVGKTTVMYQTVRSLLGTGGIAPERIWWFRLDHPLLMHVHLGDLVRFVVQSSRASVEEPAFVFLDELSYADDWDLWLKTFYDERWPIRVIGSSSSTAILRKRRMESGVGRWEEQFLTPYLLNEYFDLIGKSEPVPCSATLPETIEASVERAMSLKTAPEERDRFMFTGGFPELLVALKDRDLDDSARLLESQRTLRNDAIERAVYKDIPQAFNIDMPQTLERLLYVLAEQVTGVLSPSILCQTIDRLSQPTLDRYISYLEKAFLVFTLQNYAPTESSRQRRGRKVYFLDCAVRNAALQRGLAPLSDPRERGVLYENLAAAHLYALGLQSQVRVYHWRDGAIEVDLIYDHPERPLAFEIASSTSHARRSLSEFRRRFPRFANGCFLVAPGAPAISPPASSGGIGSLPLDLFLLAVGAQAEHALLARLV